ncbi:MAG: 4'-phosphopantetheinyl transferase superfamily protein [Muribaculaceae bacterium]
MKIEAYDIEGFETFMVAEAEARELTDEEYLHHYCNCHGIDTNDITSARSEKVRKERYLTRMLLTEMVDHKQAMLKHEPSGKPILDGIDRSISISHSWPFVAIMIGTGGCNIGIDIETQAERAHRVRSRFLNRSENAIVAEGDSATCLMAWTAKEAIYKATGVEHLSLADDIALNIIDNVAKPGIWNKYIGEADGRQFDVRTMLHISRRYAITATKEIKQQ